MNLQEYIRITRISLPVLEAFWNDKQYSEFRHHNKKKFNTAHIAEEDEKKLFYEITGKQECPTCHRFVIAQDGKFPTHGPGPYSSFICPGSGTAAPHPS